MDKRIIQADAVSKTIFHETDDGFAIQSYQDLTAVVERCKREAIEGRITGPEHGVHAATVPAALLQEWAEKKGIGIREAMRNDKILDQFLAEHPVFDLTKGRAQKYFAGGMVNAS